MIGKNIMCSTPKTPKVEDTPVETLATPTAADASVSKASNATRNNAAGSADRNIKTSARGLLDEPTTKKKGLLGE